MNTLGKIGLAGVLSMSYVSAHAAFAEPYSTTPGDVLVFGEVLNSTGALVGSYAADTGIAVNNSLGTGTQTLVSSADANYQSFITLGTATGNTIEWAVQGGGGTGNGKGYGTIGAAKFLSTQYKPTGFADASTQGGNLSAGFSQLYADTVALNNNLTNTTATSIFGTSGAATAGLWDTTSTGSNIATWHFNGPAGGTQVCVANQTGGCSAGGLGVTSGLYYVTGSGSETTPVSVTQIGTVQLTSSGVTFTAGTTSVPLPPAVWLLGSGLLGLAGISRRKATTVTA